ncbi:unnamed protein product [Discosporangium mesarthrocarpum]
MRAIRKEERKGKNAEKVIDDLLCIEGGRGHCPTLSIVLHCCVALGGVCLCGHIVGICLYQRMVGVCFSTASFSLIRVLIHVFRRVLFFPFSTRYVRSRTAVNQPYYLG